MGRGPKDMYLLLLHATWLIVPIAPLSREVRRLVTEGESQDAFKAYRSTPNAPLESRAAISPASGKATTMPPLLLSLPRFIMMAADVKHELGDSLPD